MPSERFVPASKNVRLIHRMQIWRTSRQARVYLRENKASEASRVLFWLLVWSRLSDWVDRYGLLRVVSCLIATKKEILLELALPLLSRDLFTKKLRIHAILRKRKCVRFTCLRREDSRKYLNEIIFARDGAVPWCLHGLLFIQQKVNILENGSINCRL